MNVILSRYRYEDTMMGSTSRQLFKKIDNCIWVCLDDAKDSLNIILKAEVIWNRVIWREMEIERHYPFLLERRELCSIANNGDKMLCSNLREYCSKVCESMGDVVRAIDTIKSNIIVVKRIVSSQGNGVFFVRRDKIVDVVKRVGYPMIVEEYIENQVKGRAQSERVLITQKDIIVNYNRLGPLGSKVANICGGGKAADVGRPLSKRKKETLKRVMAEMVSKGIFLAGVDFVGDELIEVNVASPTLPYLPEYGIDEIEELVISIRECVGIKKPIS